MQNPYREGKVVEEEEEEVEGERREEGVNELSVTVALEMKVQLGEVQLELVAVHRPLSCASATAR